MVLGASWLCTHRAARVAALLGTSSFLTLLAETAAFAAAAPAPVEEVLVTGSLIRGAPAVGVPVTALTANEFGETGALTTAQLMNNIVSIDTRTDVSPLIGGGSTDWSQNVSVHGIQGSGGDAKTLLLIDGRRWPIQGHGGDTVDPSIVPPIAIQRIDVLTSGASAVYGSDAVTGVINVILKRGFDGAQTQFTFSRSQDISGPPKVDFQQIWGRTWDTGNVTISLEAAKQSRIKASARSNLLTQNFEPWGLFNPSRLGYAAPAIVSTGSPTKVPGTPSDIAANVSTRYCANCYSLPHGIGWDFGTQNPGPTTTWSTIQAGAFKPLERNEQNYRDMWADADMQPQQELGAAVITVDQELTNDFWGLGPVAFFATGFWYNRQAVAHYPNTATSGDSREHIALRQANGIAVSTVNPYYPTGAPANLRVFYDFSPDLGGGARITGSNRSTRGEAGFNFDKLPFDWSGKLSYSYTDDKNSAHSTNMINTANATAALNGSFSVTTDAFGTIRLVKPANVPYLNIFCDPLVHQCNSQTTLNYITGNRNQDEAWKIRQMSFNFQGPVFEVPAGQVQVAIAGETIDQHYSFSDAGTARGVTKEIPSVSRDVGVRNSWAVFGQVNVPLVGGEFSAPFFEQIDLELGYRIDKYKDLDDHIKTPKIAANWVVGWGFTFRGAWGKAFRAPGFGQTSAFSGSRAIGRATGDITNGSPMNCLSVGGSPGGTALPGSVTALLNPRCASDNNSIFPGGIDLQGGSSLSDPVRGIPLNRANGQAPPPKGLAPESAKQWILGFHYQPTEGLLSGLTVDGDWYNILLEDTIQSNTTANGDPNNPAASAQFLVIPRPELPITDAANAAFFEVVKQIAAGPSVEFAPDLITQVKWIHDSTNVNLGYVQYTGIDLDTRYDWDMGDWGSWNVGASAFYELNVKTKSDPNAAAVSDYQGRNSGSHLQKVRYRLGWSDGTLSITGFANYRPHRPATGDLFLPACYYAAGFGPGSCYPGSPYYPQTTDIFYDGAPAFYTLDLNLQYNTGTIPANTYLQNINFSLTISNLQNRTPSFMYASRAQGREARSFDDRWSLFQRTFTLSITKNW